MKKIVIILVAMLLISSSVLTVVTSLKINSNLPDQVDQVQEEGGYCKIPSDSISYAQSFIPTLPILTRVEINVAGHYKCSIRSQLTGQDLTSVTEDYPLSDEWRFFDFDPDLHVTPDETYYIVLIPQDDAFICYGENTGYTRGCLQISEDGGYTWGYPRDSDMQFRTYGQYCREEVWVDDNFNSNTQGWQIDHFDAIQDGVDAVCEYGTVNVKSGNYHENIEIDKSLNLIGEDKINTIIDGNNIGAVIKVTDNLVNINGFTFTTNSDDNDILIKLRANDCNIENNILILNVVNHGIDLLYSNDNNIFDNIVTGSPSSNSIAGIKIYHSDGNIIKNNIITKITYEHWGNGYGILVKESKENRIIGNTVSENNYHGICLCVKSTDNLIEDNTVSNNLGFSADGISLLSASNDNILNNNIVTKNYQIGISLNGGFGGNVNNNIITNNTVTNNLKHGITFIESSGNTIKDNIIQQNLNYGIIFGQDSNNNLIFNNYFDNPFNAKDDCNNNWNIDKTNGQNIIGGQYLGGNYWSDYTGVDNDVPPDGLGDTLLPYTCSGNIVNGGDYHPLVGSYDPGRIGITDSDLTWADVPPGGNVTGFIQIINDGGDNTRLNWKIAEYPSWGTWTFIPENGQNLKPEDGPVQVEVEVEAPEEKDEEFEGQVKIINLDDPDDSVVVPVSLSTPKNKAINIQFLRYLNNYPLIKQLLQRFLEL